MKYAQRRWLAGRQRRLPEVLQSEAAECGLACVTMIAAYHGHDVDLPSLRRRYSPSLRGSNLFDLAQIAHEMKLEGRGLRVELNSLGAVRTPCILHWGMNHFVVLKKVTRTHLLIHDPSSGAHSVSWEEAGKLFTGVALELSKAPDFAPIEERRKISLQQLAGQVFGLRRAAAQVVALAIGIEVLALLLPFQLQWAIDEVLVSNDGKLLGLLACAFLGLIVMRTLLSLARGWTISALSGAINAQWSTNLFSHLLKLPFAFFEKRQIGDILSRFSSIQIIQKTLTGSFAETILDGFTSVLMLVVLCLYSPLLALVVVVSNAAYIIGRSLAYRRLRGVQEEQYTYQARQQTEMFESINGAQTIILANNQFHRQARFAAIAGEVAGREVAIQRFSVAFASFGDMSAGIERIAIIWLATHFAMVGVFTAGMMVLAVAYADQFTARMRSLTDKTFEFRLLSLHAERIADIALTSPEPHVHSAYQGGALDATIELKDLRFRYSENEPWILDGGSLRIVAGESIAIVGTSGCGKTTLAKVILGLLPPSEGAVCFGGVDIRQFGLGDFRARLGAVMQEDRLFSGTIADNIAFFDPAAELSRIREVAHVACIADDIARMPMGYNTLVGGMGASMSGGQKQRILLARALLREPKVLLLDEATSHLDTQHERSINSAISSLKMTRIIIAHRHETIASADRVVRVVGGKLIPITAADYRRLSVQEMKPSTGEVFGAPSAAASW